MVNAPRGIAAPRPERCAKELARRAKDLDRYAASTSKPAPVIKAVVRW